jgi:hypothetical protein
MIGSTRRRVGALVLLACGLRGAPAAAQSGEPSDGTTEEARVLYVEGRDLRRRGELEKSLEKFQAAYALHPTAITALEVGRARALTGKLRAAVEALEEIERMPVRPNESDKASAARAEARELAAQVRARTPTLRLVIEGAGARVWVDGEPIPTDQLDRWLVDPGTHHVEAVEGERRVAQDLRVREGEQRDVDLRPQAATQPAPALIPQGNTIGSGEPTTTPGAAPPRTNVLAYIGFGVGGVGLATGAVTGILTLSQASRLKDNCVRGVCPPSAGLDGTQTLGTVSTVAFIAGGVGIAVGIAALVMANHGPEVRNGKGARSDLHRGPWIRPWLGAASGGVEGVF